MTTLESKELDQLLSSTTKNTGVVDAVQEHVDSVVEEMAISQKELVVFLSPSPVLSHAALSNEPTSLGYVDSTLLNVENVDEAIVDTSNEFGDENEEELIAVIEQLENGATSDNNNNNNNNDNATVNPQDILDEEKKFMNSQEFDMNLFDDDNDEDDKEEDEEVEKKKSLPEQQQQQLEEVEEEEELAPTVVEAEHVADETTENKKKHGRTSSRTGSKQEPKKNKGKGKKAITEPQPVEEEEEEEEEKTPEYEIEKIVSHKIHKGKVMKYEIKWKGYSSADNTMEAANQMHEDIYDICAAYWDSLPNVPRPSNAPVSKKVDVVEADITPTTSTPAKRKRFNFSSSTNPSTAATTTITKTYDGIKEQQPKKIRKALLQTTTTTATATTKATTTTLDHVPQYMLERGYHFPTTTPNAKTKWNLEMKKFSAVQLSPTDKNVRMAFIEWNNGEKTIHTLEEVHQKCPEKLIQYYEERLRFV